MMLTASQEYILSSNPNIYSALATDNLRDVDKVIDDSNASQLRSLIVLNEINVIEGIMQKVAEHENESSMEVVIELLLWRHCQSFESSTKKNTQIFGATHGFYMCTVAAFI
mmetsp:Transcript_33022/g.52899  ORF Transcript_33022/g.52899 Transcript_33022/m.52899 type:complete len:111 (-) Transcript_33022:217-549(-)